MTRVFFFRGFARERNPRGASGKSSVNSRLHRAAGRILRRISVEKPTKKSSEVPGFVHTTFRTQDGGKRQARHSQPGPGSTERKGGGLPGGPRHFRPAERAKRPRRFGSLLVGVLTVTRGRRSIPALPCGTLASFKKGMGRRMVVSIRVLGVVSAKA